MKLSIVATLYQSSLYIEEFCRRSETSARKLFGDNFEIILVNDGSPDNSLEIAVNLSNNSRHIVVVDLSRNFGHHKAILTGLSYSQGDLVYLIDVDLEEEPEWLIDFSPQLKNGACDVVYGMQNLRKGKWFERWSGQFFWKLINKLSGLNMPINITTARLMTRRYVDALLLHREREVFLAGLWHITGFNQVPFFIEKKSKGTSTYTFRKKISLFVNSVTSFSSAPLVSVFYFGILISIIAAVFSFKLVFQWFFFDKPLAGWTSIMASIWLLGGLIISFIGVVGIYISKLFIEIKQRPNSIIRQIYGRSSK